ncbi:enoyl-CoA hydratase domain-containing protein 3, mitochondrial-like [Teleopsis dalmanni]|uniref:enoyl-CoA hydratase domain-containing protein 3, mitochondrial-like n=1 Tax=Teleopsis dalmanni TaxID=139649 RepID=UPI0018CEE22F|nr:enoyl-CoA hydratase domain-containing protein 3, mitochondrial-like [Teleopsis dalmanni]
MFKIFRAIINNKKLTNVCISTVERTNSSCTIVTQCKGVREITFNEPETRNTLSIGMMDTLHENIMKDSNDEELRCIVLSSKGPVWSSGHNLKEIAASNAQQQMDIFNKLAAIIYSIHSSPVPVIAKINGLATAGGLQLAASCDLVVCSDVSSFSAPAAQIGIFCNTPGVAISRVMQRLQSNYMLLTGLPISAQEAYIAGLASKVVPEAQLDEEMCRITNSITTKSRAVIALGKQFYYKQLNMSLKDAYVAASEKMVENLNLDDGREGVKSFLEKREPVWTHK